ncbi:hypothetical protein [Salinarimonas ramus]|uniref:Alpha/beta hydrolase family protein n=1 Tax=Salinarimonas ramus TaxID=690164 RepID=A0A917Q6K4_9HYPH|nr:hypothetical protein [Salinarimonas ramus]GGK30187.1 hypothetical protein GCM10011322_15890 [Salinarimonas ramus]
MADHFREIGIAPFVQETDVAPPPPERLVVVLHGMRDDGFWRHTFQAEADRFVSGRVAIEAVNFGRLDTWAFLTGSKARLIEEFVLGRIATIVARHPDARLFFFAHSYGTSVLARLVPRIERRITGVFLAGAICHPIDAGLFDSVETFVVNECGVHDVWPLVAATVKPSVYGPVGTCGFNGAPIVDRFFRYDHSGALTQEHFRHWVLPAIVTERLRRSKPIDPGWRKHVPVYARRCLVIAVAALILVVALQLG